MQHANPVKICKETEARFCVFDPSKYLDANDVVGLQNLKDEYRGPAEDEDSHHHP